MAVGRGMDGAEPLREGIGSVQEEHRLGRASVLAVGTLACPHCDAPVLPAGRVSPAAALACPFCGHGGAVREFLSLEPPSRPTRVEVRAVPRVRR